SRSLVSCEKLGKSVWESTTPPEYCCSLILGGFQGPSLGSHVSTWLGAPVMVIKMQALALPRGFTPGLPVCASPFGAIARKAPAWAAPKSSLRREMKWSGWLQKCFGMALVVEQEI